MDQVPLGIGGNIATGKSSDKSQIQRWEDICYHAVLHRSFTTKEDTTNYTRSATTKYYKDFLRQVYICGMVGKGVLRTNEEVHHAVDYEIYDDSLVQHLVSVLTDATNWTDSTLELSDGRGLRCTHGTDTVTSRKCVLTLVFYKGDMLNEVFRNIQYRYGIFSSIGESLENGVEEPRWVLLLAQDIYAYVHQVCRCRCCAICCVGCDVCVVMYLSCII